MDKKEYVITEKQLNEILNRAFRYSCINIKDAPRKVTKDTEIIECRVVDWIKTEIKEFVLQSLTQPDKGLRDILENFEGALLASGGYDGTLVNNALSAIRQHYVKLEDVKKELNVAINGIMQEIEVMTERTGRPQLGKSYCLAEITNAKDRIIADALKEQSTDGITGEKE